MDHDRLRVFFTRWKESFLKGFRARPGRNWAGAPLAADGTLGESLRTESERFVLAPMTPADAAALRALTDHPAITDAISFLSSPFSLADANRLIAANGSGNDAFMGVRRRADHALVAVVGAHLRGDMAVEIGYWVGATYHNQGYASEALGVLLAKLAAAYPNRQVIAECRPENAASVRVLWKLGFAQTNTQGVRPGRVVYARGARFINTRSS